MSEFYWSTRQRLHPSREHQTAYDIFGGPGDMPIKTVKTRTEAMALVWALNNPQDLVECLHSARIFVKRNKEIGIRFPDELSETVMKEGQYAS